MVISPAEPPPYKLCLFRIRTMGLVSSCTIHLLWIFRQCAQ